LRIGVRVGQMTGPGPGSREKKGRQRGGMTMAPRTINKRRQSAGAKRCCRQETIKKRKPGSRGIGASEVKARGKKRKKVVGTGTFRGEAKGRVGGGNEDISPTTQKLILRCVGSSVFEGKSLQGGERESATDNPWKNSTAKN